MFFDMIIPTYNEALAIGPCLRSVQRAAKYFRNSRRSKSSRSYGIRVTISDGGSRDDTCTICKKCFCGSETDPPIYFVKQPEDGERGRGAVLRRGAEHVQKMRGGLQEGLFVFLHADCAVPESFFDSIAKYMYSPIRGRPQCGFCRMNFGKHTRDFKMLEWIASFDSPFTSFGDQGIVVTKKKYFELGGMPQQPLCEDVEFFCRCRNSGTNPTCLPITIRVSPRKFDERGVYLYMAQCCIVCIMYHVGVSPRRLLRLYSNPYFLRSTTGLLALLLAAVGVLFLLTWVCTRALFALF